MLLLQLFQLLIGLLIADGVGELLVELPVGLDPLRVFFGKGGPLGRFRIRFAEALDAVDQHQQAQDRQHDGEHSCQCRMFHALRLLLSFDGLL
ncbi:MAG: hypothetical protein II032_06785 [Treponema sp.]|nr:hypothetical protein [Treponema sp.]